MSDHNVSSGPSNPGSPLRASFVSETIPGSPKGSLRRAHIYFILLCVISGFTFWGPLSTLARLAYHSEYYTHTLVIPFLVAYMVYMRRNKIFADSHASLGYAFPLFLVGTCLFLLQKWSLAWAGQQNRLSLAVFSVTLFWMGSYALCYGRQAFRLSLFPLFALLLTVPLPMAVMTDLIHMTRVGSAKIASVIFSVVGIPFIRDGFLFILPKVSIEIAKACSGIHSTIALLVLTLVSGYLFLRSPWRRAFLLLFVFPIVSLTNGLRIATLTLLAEYVDRNIFNTSLHRRGGALFFLLAFGLMALLIRFLSVPERRDGTTPEQLSDKQPHPCFEHNYPER